MIIYIILIILLIGFCYRKSIYETFNNNFQTYVLYIPERYNYIKNIMDKLNLNVKYIKGFSKDDYNLGKLFFTVDIKDLVTDSVSVIVNIEEKKNVYIQNTFFEKTGNIDLSQSMPELMAYQDDYEKSIKASIKTSADLPVLQPAIK